MWFGWDYSDTWSDRTADVIATLVLLAFAGWMCALIAYGVVLVIRGTDAHEDD